MGIVDDTLGTNIFGENSTDRAIGAQTNATNEANATMERIYGQQRKDLEPWREAGVSALEQMQGGNLSSMITSDPGYQFRLDQGTNALNASAGARGMGNSGAQMKALQRYGQDYASNEYGNAWNRLSSLAGMGSGANQQGVQAAGQYGQSVAANQMGMGNAQAAAYTAQGNRFSNLLGQGIGAGVALASAPASSAAGKLLASDERLKTEIKPANFDKKDVQELREAIKPYSFKYIDGQLGEGDFFGVMAQDLEKTKLGKTLVEEKDGFKYVNVNKATSLFLATLAEG